MIKQHVCFDRRVPQKMLLPFSFPHLNATAKLKVLRRQHQHEELDMVNFRYKIVSMSSPIQSG